MHELLLDGLKRGAEIEREGIEFYSVSAKAVSDPRGKGTLEYLAREEAGHLKFIERLSESIRENKKISRVIDSYLKKPKVFPDKKEFGKKIKAGAGDKEILEEAKKVEITSIKFYDGLSKKVTGEPRRIFETLAGEEKKHLAWIEFMASAMEVHGYWEGIEKYFALDG